MQLADWSIGGYSVYNDVASFRGVDMEREVIWSVYMLSMIEDQGSHTEFARANEGAEKFPLKILDLNEQELCRGERPLSLTSEKPLTRLGELLDLPCTSTDLHGDSLGV